MKGGTKFCSSSFKGLSPVCLAEGSVKSELAVCHKEIVSILRNLGSHWLLMHFRTDLCPMHPKGTLKTFNESVLFQESITSYYPDYT